MFTLIRTISTFYFQDLKTKEFILVDEHGSKLTDSPAYASDFSLGEATGRSKLYSVLRLGIKAVSCDRGHLTAVNEDDADGHQQFVLNLTRKGTFVIKHEDKCLMVDRNKSLTTGDCKSPDVAEFIRTSAAGYNIQSPSFSNSIPRSRRTTTTIKKTIRRTQGSATGFTFKQ